MSEALAAVIEPTKEVESRSPAPKEDITDVVVSSWNDMQRMAKAFSNSALIPTHLKGKFEDVLLIMQQAKELGIGPVQGLSGINVIQGKPSVSPELQLALIRERAPGAVIEIETDPKALSVKVTMAPSRARMSEAYTSMWDMARAKSMGLAEKDNYKKQPLTMLKWRAIGDAARTVFPHITKGLYNSVEAEDFTLRPEAASNKADELNKKFGIKKEDVIVEAQAKSFDDVDDPEELHSGIELEG